MMKENDNVKDGSSSKMVESKFAKHVESLEEKESERKGGVTTLCGRIFIFIVFPAAIGGLALASAFLTKLKDPDHKINIDRDFFYPATLVRSFFFFFKSSSFSLEWPWQFSFLLQKALTLCIIVGFQTRGYAKDKLDPLIAWPKVYKRKKIIHQHVVKGSKDNTKLD